MAQTIVTLCDEHLERQDEQIPGLPYEIGVRLPGNGWEFVQIDACAVCAKPIVDLLEQIRELGRGLDDVEIGARETHQCPTCGKSYKHRSSLRAHFVKEHETSLSNVEATPDAFVCQDCDESFNRAQSLSVHRRYKHGVVGMSREVVRKRAKAAAEANGVSVDG